MLKIQGIFLQGMQGFLTNQDRRERLHGQQQMQYQALGEMPVITLSLRLPIHPDGLK
jgi:hypothetical protein